MTDTARFQFVPGSLVAMEVEDDRASCYAAATYDDGLDVEDLDHHLDAHERDAEHAAWLCDVLSAYAEDASRFAP